MSVVDSIIKSLQDGDEDFELTDVNRPTDSYWLNTEFKFYAVAAGQRYRTEGNRRVDYSGK